MIKTLYHIGSLPLTWLMLGHKSAGYPSGKHWNIILYQVVSS